MDSFLSRCSSFTFPYFSPHFLPCFYAEKSELEREKAFIFRPTLPSPLPLCTGNGS